MLKRVSSALSTIAWSCLFVSASLAVPVAVNDAFTTAEDTPLTSSSVTLFNGDFEPIVTTNYAAGSWNFLDTIQNQNGTPASQTYPLDGTGKNWKALGFNIATSTIGAWGTHDLPIQYGGIDVLAGAANVISSSVVSGGGNPVTTVLYRKVFTVGAIEAAILNWNLHYVVDDGMIVYLNGTEIARVGMPADPITPDTLASASGNEGAYTDLPITLPASLMVSGQNVLAVEVHQINASSSDVGLDMTFTPGVAVDDGFVGVEKAFGTNPSTNNNSGNNQDVEVAQLSTTAGFGGGGAATVDVGYRPLAGAPLTGGTNNDRRSTSAAWQRTFVLPTATTLHLSFRHRLQLAGSMPATEWGETMLQIDSTKFGTTPANGAASYPAGWKAISRTAGTGAATVDSGWQQYSADISLGAGTHTLLLGAFSNTTGFSTRHIVGSFDDILGTIPGAGGGVLDNDTGGAISAQLVSTTTHGALVLNTDGTFSYTPAANFFGTDSFTYKASDGTTLSATAATATITVTPVNDAPVAVADAAYSTTEDTPLTIAVAAGVLANDSDADGDPITAILNTTVSAASGTLTLNSNGSFTYVPALNFNGTATFTYHAKDAVADSNIVTATITVTPVNDAPVAVGDAYRVPKNGSLTITDINGVTVQEDIISSAVRDGSNVITTPGSIWKYFATGASPSGSWTSFGYDDSAWAEGASELGYGDALDNPAWPEATVIPDDAVAGYTEPPVGNRYISYYFRKGVAIPNVTEVTDINLQIMRDDGAIVYVNGTPAYRNNLVADPTYSTFGNNTNTEKAFHDAALLGLDNSGENTNWLNVAPTPSLLVEGDNMFAVEIHQSTLTSSDVSFDLKCTLTRLTNPGLLKNDTDAENATLTAVKVSNPSHGTVTVNSNGTFTYTPTVGYVGADSFTYKANDGSLDSNIATVTLNVVNAGNVKPVAVNDSFLATEDTTLTVPAATGVLANDTDADGDPLTAELISNVTHGTLTLNANGSFSYLAAANYNGTDSFTYKTRDDSNNLSVAAATVTITIAAVNDSPVAVNDDYATNPGQTLTVGSPGVLSNDTDVDSLPAALSAQLVTPPSAGSLTLNLNGSFTYAPAASGTFAFTYRASDGNSTSALATVTIVVNGAPNTGADSYLMVEDNVLSVQAPGVLSNDNDPENAALTAVKLADPAHGTVALNSNGSFVYTPAHDYAGTDSFTYAANDGVRTSISTNVTITVTNVNDPPVGQADAYEVSQNQSLNISAGAGVLANDVDPDAGSSLSATLVQSTTHGTLIFNAGGSFSYTPAADYLGTDFFTYTVSDGTFVSSSVSVTLSVVTPVSQVVINEIMFRPAPNQTNIYPENTLLEFVELYNRSTSSANISGWQFTSGLAYTVPANTTIPAGGYLVVASNVAAFQAAYPSVTNVIGGWVGSLSNTTEKVQIANAAGISQDSVTYSSEGDWAQRIRETTYGGWDWNPLTKGGGRSLELRNPQVSNDNGQNWQPSAVLGGTPGAANASFTANIPPIIHGVKHSPAIPSSKDRVIISCDLNDESPITALTATLFYRDATTTTPPAFSSMPMSSDGTGTWFAVLPAKANLTIMEFYVSASDGTLTRTWPAPTPEGQNANCQYQVNDEALSSTAETVHMVLTAAENAAYNTVATNNSGSNREFNQTLIVVRGPETSIRYRCSMRIRGNSSRSYQFKPLRVTIPADDSLNGAMVFNLNPKAAHLQYLGLRLFQASGMRVADSIPVELRRNGVEYTTSSGSTPDFGKWVRLEDEGGEVVNNHWPEASSGNFYKKIDNGGSLNAYWRSTSAAPTNPDSLLDGWSKQNNTSANDWTDLRSFFQAWQAASADHFPGSTAGDAAGSNGSRISGIGNWNSTAFTAGEMTSLAPVADFDQWARFFAVMTILQDLETKISNGVDDDYSCYFDPSVAGQRRMQLVPHDLDTIFGLGDDQQSATYVGLYDATELGQAGYTFRTLLPLLGTTTVAGNADFRAKYFDAIKELLGTVFNADTTASANPPFYALVDNLLGTWAPAATRTSIKNFATARRTYLLGLIGSGATTPPAGTSNATLTSAHGSLMIHEVLANNVAAHQNGGLYPDVIELRNTGASAVSLAGKSLTDDPLIKTKYVFPAGSTIAAGGYLVLYGDSATAAPGLHLGFGLNADGDAVYLYDTVASGQALLDSVTFGIQAPDFSIGRTGAALDVWALCPPTVGAANTPVPALASPADLKINEWLGNADFLASTDFVELYNPGATPVALGGVVLTNDAINYPNLGTIPALSFLPAGGFYAFEAKGNSATPGNARELPYSLDSTFGNVTLLGANESVVDRVDTISQFRDVSVGRLPDGTPGLGALAVPSPGATNAALTTNELNLINYLRITEMMYNPATGSMSEYIELRNMSDKSATPVSLELGGVYFSNGINYTFPAVSLAAGAHFVLVGEAAKFTTQFPSVPIGGVFASGKLDNAGERVRLNIPSGTVSILDFKYASNWYPSTDGGGDALQIVDGTAARSLWDKKEGWQAGIPSPGTTPAFSVNAGPDLSTPPSIPLYLNGSVIRGAVLPENITEAWTKDSGPGAVTFTTGDYQDANATFSAPGVYVLRLTATAITPASSASDTITVIVTQNYATWAAATITGPFAGQQGQMQDPDGDGIPNLIEYATGTNPLVADSPFTFETVNGTLSIRYNRSKLIDPAVRIYAQFSSELQDWMDDANGSAVLTTMESETSTSQSFLSTSLQGGPRLFGRLFVILP